jgi:hypothetical protein
MRGNILAVSSKTRIKVKKPHSGNLVRRIAGGPSAKRRLQDDKFWTGNLRAQEQKTKTAAVAGCRIRKPKPPRT